MLSKILTFTKLKQGKPMLVLQIYIKAKSSLALAQAKFPAEKLKFSP
jgi:hypothetical protein